MFKVQSLTVLTVLALLSADLVGQDNKPARTGFVRGSQVIGMDIHNNDHQKIGTVEDIVLDQDNNTIAFAVVALDPAMNADGKLLAIPFNSLRPQADSKTFVVDLAKDRIEKASKFDKSSWPEMNAQWSNEVFAFFGSPSRQRTDRQTEPMPTGDLNRDNLSRDRDMNLNRDNHDNTRREVVTLSGKVKSFQQREPAELIVNTDRGDLVAQLGPVSFLNQQSLGFDPNTDVTMRGYHGTAADGRRVFVVTEVVGRDGRSVRLRGDDFQPLWVQNRAERDRQPANGYTGYTGTNTGTNLDLRDLNGTVVYVDQSGPCGESVAGRLVTIRTDSGDRVVALGPGHYLARQHHELRPSDTVFVRGWETTQDGRRIFVATEIRRGNETWRLRREDGTPLW